MVTNCAAEITRISHKIKGLRINRGLTVQELALRCDMERSNLSRIESGRHNITLRSICKICNALEIEIPDLFAR